MDKKKILSIFIKVSIPIVLLAVALVIILGRGRKDAFSLTDYVSVDIRGVDGNGIVDVVADKEGLSEYFVNDKTTDIEKYRRFVESVRYSADVTEGLSNGDKVRVTVQYDEALAEELGIRTGALERDFKVTGLKDGILLDAFRGLQIITSGVSPYITVTYNNQSENEYLKTLEYEFNRTSGIELGDKITITCKADEEYAASMGYYFDTLVMEYTIDKADMYIEKQEDVNKSVLSTIVEDAKKVISDATADRSESVV